MRFTTRHELQLRGPLLLIFLGFVPLTLVLHYFTNVPPLVVFVSGVLAIVPLAEWIRRATEQLAHRLGHAIGGLLNVSFGNTAELLLAIFVLLDGKDAVVKGQITGSIIGNSLLGLGLAIVVGTWGRARLTFNRESAGRLSSLLILSVVALLLPALFDYTERDLVSQARASTLDEHLSLGVSIVLILLYLANLAYTLITHRDIFSSAGGEEKGSTRPDESTLWPAWMALVVLVVATAITAWQSEIVAGELESAADALGVTTFFLGIVVLAVIGNAAEYVAAVYFARRDQMTLVMGITVGSTVQIALLVAPLLVIISHLVGKPMDLVFTSPLELIAIAGVAFTVNAIAMDGETTWFEGVLLLGVWLLLAMAFFFVTPPVDTNGQPERQASGASADSILGSRSAVESAELFVRDGLQIERRLIGIATTTT